MSTFDSTTENINGLFERISILVCAIKRAGTPIEAKFDSNVIQVICYQENISAVVDTTKNNAISKLKSVISQLEEITTIDLAHHAA